MISHAAKTVTFVSEYEYALFINNYVELCQGNSPLNSWVI